MASLIKFDSIDDVNIIVSTTNRSNCVAFVSHEMVRKSNRNGAVKQIDDVFLVSEVALINCLVCSRRYTQHVNDTL